MAKRRGGGGWDSSTLGGSLISQRNLSRLVSGSAGWGLEWAMTWMAERPENGTENKVLHDFLRGACSFFCSVIIDSTLLGQFG
jgi:hypothetical protein